MNQKQHSLMQVLQKISIFKGLELGHILHLLKVGTSQRYGCLLYTSPSPRD